ncbi:MAG: 16S rRNA (adenine(1518)-N(6)/adenine(1519)-N(6))-dimethyltransferase RsmA [Microthrixaceae bacterium]
MLDAEEIQQLLRGAGLDARRSLGQNFVADPALVHRIAALAGVGPGDHVVEVGPGLGSLTLALADTGADVLALEKDEALVPLLAQVLGSRGVRHVTVRTADALEADWPSVLAGAPSWTFVANLPYNVAVPIVLSVLEHAPMVQRLVVMVQREVAERLAAGPGGRTIGIPSLRVAWYGTAELLDIVPPEVFVPPPRIESALLGIVRRPPPSTTVGEAEVLDLVTRGYRQRRKMLRSTLGGLVSPATFDAAGIDPTTRPEQLSIQDWVDLAVARRSERDGSAP